LIVYSPVLFTHWHSIPPGAPNVFWFSAFFFQQALMTGVLQNYARAASIAIDRLMWNFEILKDSEGTWPDPPAKGCYINGLFMEGARWSNEDMVIADSIPKVLISTVPILWLKVRQLFIVNIPY
jgi:dynein heavy chain, axonemal